MTILVVDANIVIKWVVTEKDSASAIALRSAARFIAPELLIAELGNILHKKVARREVKPDDAELLATLLTRANVELRPMRALLPVATRLAVRIGHPAYDCFYLALALSEGRSFVTADEKFLRKLDEGRHVDLRRVCMSLSETVSGIASSQ